MELVFEILGFALAFGCGMACGSYATMPYYRLPNDIPCAGKWIGHKSACPECGHQLRTRDLLPVFNWLLTFGKCQFCGAKVNPMYFFIESSYVVLSCALYLTFGFGQEYILLLPLMGCLIVLTATDITYKVTPDAVYVVMLLFGFPYRVLMDGEIYAMIDSLALAVLIGLAYAKLREKITGEDFTGYNYMKFVAIVGVWLSMPQFFTFLLVFAVVGGLLHLRYRSSAPFAAALSFAFLWQIFLPETPGVIWSFIKPLIL